MCHGDGADGHFRILKKESRSDFVDVGTVVARVLRLEAEQADGDVVLPGGFEVSGHVGRSLRAIHVERRRSLEHPRRKHQIGQSQRVIRMEMREEHARQRRHLQRGDTRGSGRLGSPHDADAGINKIDLVKKA